MDDMEFAQEREAIWSENQPAARVPRPREEPVCRRVSVGACDVCFNGWRRREIEG
jgi:hypothetical protein